MRAHSNVNEKAAAHLSLIGSLFRLHAPRREDVRVDVRGRAGSVRSCTIGCPRSVPPSPGWARNAAGGQTFASKSLRNTPSKSGATPIVLADRIGWQLGKAVDNERADRFRADALRHSCK